MNTLIATAAFIATAALSTTFINPSSLTFEQEDVQEERIRHDWECNYVISDSYNGIDKRIYHYINHYTTNVDGSISFISHDGTNTWIPYPYYYVYVNEN